MQTQHQRSQPVVPVRLTARERTKMKNEIVAALQQIMFTPEVVESYVRDGIQFEGVNSWTDERIAEEFRSLHRESNSPDTGPGGAGRHGQ